MNPDVISGRSNIVDIMFNKIYYFNGFVFLYRIVSKLGVEVKKINKLTQFLIYTCIRDIIQLNK